MEANIGRDQSSLGSEKGLGGNLKKVTFKEDLKGKCKLPGCGRWGEHSK